MASYPNVFVLNKVLWNFMGLQLKHPPIKQWIHGVLYRLLFIFLPFVEWVICETRCGRHVEGNFMCTCVCSPLLWRKGGQVVINHALINEPICLDVLQQQLSWRTEHWLAYEVAMNGKATVAPLLVNTEATSLGLSSNAAQLNAATSSAAMKLCLC